MKPFATSRYLLNAALKRVSAFRRPPVACDARSRRFVALIECALNQNARDLGAACFPAMNGDLLDLCRAHDVGVLQMPCPEIAALGMRRARKPGQRIREALDTEVGRACCAGLAGDVAARVAVWCDEGYEFLGVLGGNPMSPGCAVHHRDCDEGGVVGDGGELATELSNQAGIFMQTLQAEFRRRGLPVRFMAIRDHDPELLAADLVALRALLVA